MIKNNNLLIILIIVIVILGILVIFVCRKNNKENFNDAVTKQKFLIDQGWGNYIGKGTFKITTLQKGKKCPGPKMA